MTHNTTPTLKVMEKLRSRTRTFKTQPSLAPRAAREEFNPETEWIADASNHILLVHLPGFKREEMRVQFDKQGKLLIKGSRLENDNKNIVVDFSVDVPADTITEKISGRFENECLTLTLPKKIVENPKATEKTQQIDEEKPSSVEGREKDEAMQNEEKAREQNEAAAAMQNEEETSEPKKGAAAIQNEEETRKAKKEAAATQNEEKPHEEKKEAATMQNEEKPGEEKREEDAMKKEEKIREEKKEEATMEKPTTTEETQNEPSQKKKTATEETQKELNETEKPKTMEDIEDEAIRNEKRNAEGKKKDDCLVEKLEKFEEVKREGTVQMEKTIQKVKSKIKEFCADKPKGIIRSISIWRDEGSHGTIDNILQKLNRNRNVIAVAVVAFSVGFYVSHKLRKSEVLD